MSTPSPRIAAIDTLTHPSHKLPLQEILQKQRTAFLAAPFPDAETRRRDLTKLERALRQHKNRLLAALSSDFGGRCLEESTLSEIFVVLQNLRYARKRLSNWMKPRRRHVPFQLGMGNAKVFPQPLGVVGIVSPWNFPIQLSIVPLITALSAGNRAMIKPSELSPATSEALCSMLQSIFPPEQVAVCPGDIDVARAFISLPFDHLLYTGSTEVGRHVMRAAAEHLVPLTLELGGKSPAILAPGADIMEAARDVVFGKLLNAGQICTSPDYALVPRGDIEAFARACQTVARQMYPLGLTSSDYTSIINQRHLDRLQGYLTEATERNLRILPLFNELGTSTGKLAPVLIIDPPHDAAVLSEEIFGPILSIVPYESLDEAIGFVNARPRPLALYLFSKSRKQIDAVTRCVVSGTMAINDTLTQAAIEDLPFGGVGASGMGHYHGHEGFETLSKLKPIFHRKGWRSDRLVRPPYNDWKRRFIAWLV